MDAATAKRHSIGWQILFNANRQAEREARRMRVLEEHCAYLQSNNDLLRQMLDEANDLLDAERRKSLYCSACGLPA
jgi:tRNA/tmRNA/rRNA uracil-C5-methylase (TrmA/RlmC/RlmD family)